MVSLVRATRHHAGVLSLTMANPSKRNALSSEMMGALRSALAADRDGGLAGGSRVVVISGEGSCFSAGHDLREVEAARHDAEALLRIFESCGELMSAVREHPVPVIAAVDGPAHAAGCELAASADIVVADEATATFATPGVRIGLFCHTPAVAIVRALGGGTAGARRAALMLYTGKPVSASVAASLGLVHELAPAGSVSAVAHGIAAAISQASPAVVRDGKRVLAESSRVTSREEAYRIARRAMVRGAMGGDAGEGIRAFLEKRPPVWPGRT
jgi:enoyl-CoA hydratase/carnithine racemase